MAITNEQWQKIENQLSGSYGSVYLLLGEDKITLSKKMVKENQLAVVVYINDTIKPTCGDPKGAEFKPLTEKIWRKRTLSVYSPKQQKEIVKVWGKRRAKKEFPRLEEKLTYFECYFPKFAPLQRQYKKLKNLEVISIGYQAEVSA